MARTRTTPRVKKDSARERQLARNPRNKKVDISLLRKPTPSKAKKAKTPKVASQSKQAPASGKRKRVPSAGKSTAEEGEGDFRDRTYKAKTVKKWKVISPSSQKFVKELIDEAIMNVLGKCRGYHYDDIQDMLNSVKRSITNKLATTKAPKAKFGNYMHLDSTMQLYEEMLAKHSSQLHILDSHIEANENVLEEKEAELERLQSSINELGPLEQQLLDDQVHPLLRDRSDAGLSLPDLPAESFDLPVPQLCAIDDDMEDTAVDSLTALQHSKDTSGLWGFMEKLSGLAQKLSTTTK